MKRNKRMEPPTMKNYRLAKMKGEDLRDAYAQQKFRKKLKENPQALKNLETKFGKSIDYLEASHCFSLSIAAFLNNFLDTPLRENRLKDLCNHEENFEMTTKDKNQVDDKRTDAFLQKQFQTNMLRKFQTHPYKEQLQTSRFSDGTHVMITNPTQLEFEMGQNGMKRVVLRGADFKRAQEQAKRVQLLNFTLKYQAMCRLFYC
eukprot:717923_1